MHSRPWQPIRVLTAAVLAIAFSASQNLSAQTSEHLVSPQDLQKATQDATQSRQKDIETLRGFLSTTQAQKALESAHMNPQQVQNAVAGLNDQELAQLSARASKAQSEFAAGNLDDHDLLVILVAVAVLILIIVAVH